MSTLDRLLGALSRVYDTSADPVLGLRLSYLSGQMQWTIADNRLTTTVIGGVGASLSVDLSQYTLSTLAVFLASQPGYVVLALEDTGMSSLSALALVPDSNDIATSNGDHIYIARNPTWVYMAALADELVLAETAIELGPAEMATTTADGIWLDVLGGYYAVPRQLGEMDIRYAPRIPAEVILPRLNNTAIAAALQASTGQPASVADAPVFGSPQPAFDGAISFSGAPHFFNATARLILNLFDVSIGYDLLSAFSPTDYLTTIRSQVDRLRAAGTHLRRLTLTTSVMGDVLPQPTESFRETVKVQGISGLGRSSNNASGSGFFPVLLVPLSFSTDTGIAAMTTGIRLSGTGRSVDSAAVQILAGTGGSNDSSNAVLTAGAAATLAGTGSSISLAFGALGSAALLNGTTSSTDSAGLAVLRTGVTFAGISSSVESGRGSLTGNPIGNATGSSTDAAGVVTLGTGIPIAGTGSGTDSAGVVTLGTGIRIAGTGSGTDSAGSAVLTTKIILTGTSTSAQSGTLAAGGPFSPDFSADFQL